MKRKVTSVCKYLFLCIASILSIFPLYWMVMAATNQSVEITKGTLVPGTYLLENLQNLLASDLNYMQAFKKSMVIAVITTTVAMFLSSAAGYAFEVYKNKQRDRVFSLILLSMMVPFAALMVPLFQLFSSFNKIPVLKWIAINTSGSVIMIAVATAFLIFFFRQNTKTFQKEQQEAARMYAKPDEIRAYLDSQPEKPYISCEYMHAMGNSCGGMHLYTELEAYPQYQGGFIWDYIDQAVRTVNAEGERVLAYGGDFDDRATDYCFCTDGIVYADRTPSPKAAEVKHLYSNVKLAADDKGFEVINDNLFISTEHYRFVYSIE